MARVIGVRTNVNNKRQLLQKALLFASLCILLQYSADLFALAFRKNVEFRRVSASVWEADVCHLEQGQYYVSFGQPREPCLMKLGDNLVGRTRSSVGHIRDALSLGGAFRVEEACAGKLLIECANLRDRMGRRMSRPFVAEFLPGLLLHVWKSFIIVYLGPLSAIVLLVFVFADRRVSGEGGYRWMLRLTFGVVALAYTVTLAEWPRMLGESIWQTFADVGLRCLFGFVIILMLEDVVRFRRVFAGLHVALFLVVLIAGLSDPRLTIRSYHLIVWGLTAMSVSATADFLRANKQRELPEYMHVIAVTWAVLQSGVLILGLFDVQTIITPAFLAVSSINISLARMREQIRLQAEYAVAGRISDLALRTAHDIRSPLAAFKSLEKDLEGLPDDVRNLARAATERIRDIASDLLSLSKNPAGAGETLELTDLSGLLQSLVTEKRLEFLRRSALQIRFGNESQSGSVSVLIDKGQFSRAISNLINNAVEALPDTRVGRVTLTLQSDPTHAIITIEDNGTGMDPEVLKLIGTRGFTVGKSAGHGLGLYQVYRTLGNMGGEIKFSSVPNLGTRVEVRVPRSGLT